MISADQPGLDKSREALATFFSNELASLAGEDLNAALREEIARAVAAYCAERHAEGAVPDEYLALLLTRALVAAGQGEVGGTIITERILKSGLDASGRVAAELPCSGAVLAALSAGIVRVRRTTNGEPDWTIRCDRLGLGQPGTIEILFYASLRALVEELGVTWDESSGAGVLRLRGVEAAPGVAAFVRDVLARVQAERGWQALPGVVVTV
jgi:hypothetical protein